jgi:hypothetical protein
VVANKDYITLKQQGQEKSKLGQEKLKVERRGRNIFNLNWAGEFCGCRKMKNIFTQQGRKNIHLEVGQKFISLEQRGENYTV